MTDLTVAFVTKTYAPDLERCELLARSVELLAPHTNHWIIVDSHDRAAFRGMENSTTRIVTTEDLLPMRVRRFLLPFADTSKNVWLGLQTRPIRGWLMQQIAKIAIARVAGEDVLIHADSDIALIRRFRPDALLDEGGRLRLYRIPDEIDERLPAQIRWHRTAERLLGLPPRPLPLPDYIGGLIPWRRDTAVALLAHIETRSGRDWISTLARAGEVSEYTLFGRFVDDALDVSDEQRPSSISLCHCHWGPDPLTNSELETFVAGAAAEELAVMVSAKAGMQPADYAGVLERCWASVLRD